MSAEPSARARLMRVPAWLIVGVAALVTLLTSVALWWYAFPRHAICPAVLPGPPGCNDITHLAWPWLGVVWLLFAAVVAVATSKKRTREWVSFVALGLLVAAAALSCWHVVVMWRSTLFIG